MNREKFEEGLKTIKAGWPSDKIVKEEETEFAVKLTLQCENGGYLIYSFIKPSGMPQLDAFLANKIMFQYTESLEARYFKNVSKEVAGLRIAEGRVKEALEEFSMRAQIGGVLK